MKKNSKLILSAVLILVMLVPVFTIFGIQTSAAEADAPADGVSFSEDWYYVDGDLSSAPRTIQSWIYLPDTNAKGIIIGGWSDEKHPYLSWEVVKSDGNLIPRLEMRSYYDGEKQSTSLAFSNAVLPVGEWVNLAVVIDPSLRQAICYVNGKESQRMAYANASGAYNIIDVEDRMVKVSMAVGNDLRNNYNQIIFTGKIADISLYKDAKSGKDINDYYMNGADVEADDILSYWDIEVAGKGNDVPNAVTGEPTLTYNKLWVSEEEVAASRKIDRAYSFAFIGDTQIIAENDANTGTTHLSDMYKWIVDNAESKNIKHVVGLGDITNRSTAAEWQVVQNAISQLDGVVSYSLLRGNHDNLSNSDASRNIDTYFGPGSTYISQFDGTNGALYKSSSMTNSWQSVTVGETKWLFVNIDYNPSDAVLDWAHKAIASHRDHKVIVNTHNYLWCDGTTSDDSDWTADQNNGDDIWNKLVSVHPNVTMVGQRQ